MKEIRDILKDITLAGFSIDLVNQNIWHKDV